jgi:CRISPR/Cas system-associated exonuclease Cas4 (RecB family)
VARKNPQGGYIIAAGEVGTFSVCPKAWQLSFSKADKVQAPNDRSLLGQALHQDWTSFFEESLTLSVWIRYLAVLVCLMLMAFMFVSPYPAPLGEMFQLSPRSRGFQLLLLLLLCAWLMRIFRREAQRRHVDAGFSRSEVTVAIDGGELLPEREYVSEGQGLAGKPDALVLEGNVVVPVERKPLARKLRDRYVAQLLVYMRLVEEFEGRRPPHGYLLLGPNCRRITVHNSQAKQQWVSGLLEQMRAVLDGAPAIPAPHPKKCAGCEVRSRCSARQCE